jgi:adenosylcobinamide kinase/adenosylcobinamide-phosphate guanylyltransferase
MEVVLLGTGSADGWPNAFCTCASCATERRAGRSRSQSAALVDDVLLLDCGPTTPANATRLGRTLSNVRHLLLTHAHVDHTAPAALLWRSWARRPEPLSVHGPLAAIDACRDWVGPADNVSLHVVAAGDTVTLDGYVVRALAANHGDITTGDCLLWDVQGTHGRLLYATDTGPLPQESLSALATYDLVLLEETFGDLAEHDGDHHDLATFPRTVAALRELGAVTPHTRVVAIHLGHHNPPTPELTQRLTEWGAEVHDDGAVLTTGPSTTPTQAPHRTLVIGGARAGKSVYAEGLLAAHNQVTYVATAGSRVDDEEWAERVALHRARRPKAWRTTETTDVASVLRGAIPGEAILIDCLTLWLTAVIDGADAWEDPTKAETVVRQATEELIGAWQITRALVVAVTNEVGQGVVPATVSGRLFRDALGRLNATVAAASEDVVLLVAGRPVPLPRTPLQGVSP